VEHGVSRIVVADDDAGVRGTLVALLADAGHAVTAAADGERAYSTARSEHPDTLLLDLDMPKVDGLEVCRRLKSNPQTADIRIIILTGHTHQNDRQRSFQVGADEFLEKPIHESALLERIESGS